MADEVSKKKQRRLRPSTETMRERAERNATQKPKRRLHIKLPLKGIFGRIGRMRLWRPVKFAGRFLAHFLIPPYLRSSWTEVRQVTWPNRKQTRQLTTAVILFSLVFGLIVAVFDYGLDKLFKQVILK